MQSLKALAIAAAFVPTALAAQIPRPTRAEFEGAVETGRQTKREWRHEQGLTGFAASLCSGAPEGSCGYSVQAQGPLGRAQTAAALAARKYLAFTVDSLASADTASVLTVRVAPRTPSTASGRIVAAPDVVHVVLIGVDRKTRVESAPVQPTAVAFSEITWSNLMGGSRTGVEAVASFPLEQVPAGEFYIVVVTKGKEGRFFVQAKHRDEIR